MIRIREAIPPHEIEVAKRLEAGLFLKDELYGNYAARWWVAWNGAQAVGFCAVAPCANESGVWFLARSGVLRSARGSGLQRRLIRVREAYAKRMGGTRMITYVMPDNPASANNLIRCGYKIYDPEWKWGGRGMLYFTKDLQ